MPDPRRSAAKRARGIPGGFAALPRHIMDTPEFAALSGRGLKLLVELLRQYRGANNGDLAITRSALAGRGWTSMDQLAKARDELIAAGWIIVTRQGGRHIPSLYAITWLGIDPCSGKLDVRPDPTPQHLWRPANAHHREARAAHSLHRRAEHIAPPCGTTLHRRAEQAS